MPLPIWCTLSNEPTAQAKAMDTSPLCYKYGHALIISLCCLNLIKCNYCVVDMGLKVKQSDYLLLLYHKFITICHHLSSTFPNMSHQSETLNCFICRSLECSVKCFPQDLLSTYHLQVRCCLIV